MKYSWRKERIAFIPAILAGLLMNSPVWALPGFTFMTFFQEPINNTHIHQVYNEDQFKGNWKQLKGALKENWGEFTEDDLLEIEGRTEKFEGKLQERYGERKEEVREWVDKWLEEHPYDEPRHSR